MLDDKEMLMRICGRAESSREFLTDIKDSADDEKLRKLLEKQKDSYSALASCARHTLARRGVTEVSSVSKRRAGNAPKFGNTANMALWKCERDLEELEGEVREYKKSDYDRNVAALANDAIDAEKRNVESLRNIIAGDHFSENG